MQGASRTRDTRFTRTPLSTLITKERCYATLPLIKLETSGYQMEVSSSANIAKRGSDQDLTILLPSNKTFDDSFLCFFISREMEKRRKEG